MTCEMPSLGHLVGDFLSSARAVSARDYIAQLERSASTFPPFNLILAELRFASLQLSSHLQTNFYD